MGIKPISTYYDGFYFRSRLEARWAVFFNACGVKYEYEPEGYDLGDGIWYLPDFLLHDVTFNHAGYLSHQDLYVEVKGVMSAEDAEKIKRFGAEKPILVVGDIPKGEESNALIESMYEDAKETQFGVSLYNFELVDDDWFEAYPGVDIDGTFNLFGMDSSYLCEMDKDATVNAYRMARTERFEKSRIFAADRRKMKAMQEG